ncbi:MAG: hypothetical protein ABW106_04030 [Steroidobacteraceae bacterium]
MHRPTQQLQAGDRVRLLRVPEWLSHDLLEDELEAIKAQVGCIMEVTEIDAYGYVWLGFGATTTAGETAEYRGQSFAVDAQCVEKYV